MTTISNLHKNEETAAALTSEQLSAGDKERLLVFEEEPEIEALSQERHLRHHRLALLHRRPKATISEFRNRPQQKKQREAIAQSPNFLKKK